MNQFFWLRQGIWIHIDINARFSSARAQSAAIIVIGRQLALRIWAVSIFWGSYPEGIRLPRERSPQEGWFDPQRGDEDRFGAERGRALGRLARGEWPGRLEGPARRGAGDRGSEEAERFDCGLRGPRSTNTRSSDGLGAEGVQPVGAGSCVMVRLIRRSIALRYFTSSGATNDNAEPAAPARPVRPIR